MSKFTQDFFEEDAAAVAKGLLGATLIFSVWQPNKKVYDYIY